MLDWRAFLFLSFFILTACVQENGSETKKETSATPGISLKIPSMALVTSEAGDYKVSFTNINPKFFTMKGEGIVTQTDDELSFIIKMNKAASLRSTYQNLYDGDCPDITDDKNGDGIVDINEAMEKLGRKIMPLDSDINSSNPAKNVFPQANTAGSYEYSAKGKLETIMQDLDEHEYSDNLNIEGSVVLLQGLPTYFKFPNSVESSDGLPVTETLPVACGKITKEKTNSNK